MLSPGKHYLRVPREPEANAKFRADLLAQCERDEKIRVAVLERCREDCLFFINVFVYQVDVKRLGKVFGPFITWEFQDEAVRKILDSIQCDCHEDPELHQHDLIIEKSREMGASWLMLIICVWLWLFHDRQQLLCVSRNEDAVDDGTPNCLFWKIDLILEHVPLFLLRDYEKKKHRRSLVFTHPTTGSVISGEATTKKIGVGGRSTMIVLDEFSQNDYAKNVLDRTADNSGCRLFNGTHIGLDTEFYRLSVRPDMRKLVMHWSEHPAKRKGLYRSLPDQPVEILDKDYEFAPDYEFVTDGTPTGGPYPGVRSPWYDRECRRRANARAVAMDLDIDPQGSSNQAFDRLLIKSLIQSLCIEPCWQGDVRVDEDYGKVLEFVPRPGGPLLMWRPLRINGKPKPSEYGAGGDISYGTGATPSCLSLGDARTGEKVLEYASANLDEVKFATICVALCRAFRDEEDMGAMFAWDKLGPGTRFGRRVMELGYRQIYYFKSESAKGGQGMPGWDSRGPNKKVMIEEYAWALKEGLFTNRSKLAMEETLNYKWKTSRELVHYGELNEMDPSQAGENHGDRVIADGLCWKMMKTLGCGTKWGREKIEEKPVFMSLQWKIDQMQREARERESWI